MFTETKKMGLMNMIQVHYYKEMFIETKKTRNLNNKWEVNKNKKTKIKNKTTQTQTNNVGNEHDKKSKPSLFANKYLVCNFSTFDTTCVNCQK
jgi:hypothetical protein